MDLVSMKDRRARNCIRSSWDVGKTCSAATHEMAQAWPYREYVSLAMVASLVKWAKGKHGTSPQREFGSWIVDLGRAVSSSPLQTSGALRIIAGVYHFPTRGAARRADGTGALLDIGQLWIFVLHQH